MIRIAETPEERARILARPLWGAAGVPESVAAWLAGVFGERIPPDEAVRRWLADVQQRGDAAVRDWTAKTDGVRLDALEVPRAAWRAAYDRLPADLHDALHHAARRIETFHRRQPRESWLDRTSEGTLGQLVRPMDSVGLYVPGGTVPLPSTLLMSAIPARVAGVRQIAVATPPQRPEGAVSDVILAAAHVAGVDRLFRIGGALAVGALAFGTETVPRVDKICGPGNLMVVLAKRQVFGWVGIDGLPGPTETLVIADDTANPAIAAADLLAQAEHFLASAILLTPSRPLAEAVQAEVARQLPALSHADGIAQALQGQSGIILTRDVDEAFALANAYAPEHLCLLLAEPWRWLDRVRNAGGVFLGEDSYEVLGDYVAGPSHVMPTGGTARFASPLTVADFVKRISVVGLSPATAATIGPLAERLALAEQLDAHAAAARLRRIRRDVQTLPEGQVNS